METDMSRSSELAGKALFPKVKGNPRRKDSFGYHSFEIVRRTPGITYDDFIAKGGRNSDVRYDLAHGHLTTTKPRAAAK
jgi:hypothetical protein